MHKNWAFFQTWNFHKMKAHLVLLNISSARKPVSGENWVRGVEKRVGVHQDQLPPVGAGPTPFWLEITTGFARGSEKFLWNFPLSPTWFFGLVFLTSQGLCKSYQQCGDIECSPEWGNSTHAKRILEFKNFCLHFGVFVKITLFAKIIPGCS